MRLLSRLLSKLFRQIISELLERFLNFESLKRGSIFNLFFDQIIRSRYDCLPSGVTVVVDYFGLAKKSVVLGKSISPEIYLASISHLGFLLCILFYGLKLGENEPSFLLRYLTSGASFGN